MVGHLFSYLDQAEELSCFLLSQGINSACHMLAKPRSSYQRQDLQPLGIIVRSGRTPRSTLAGRTAEPHRLWPCAGGVDLFEKWYWSEHVLVRVAPTEISRAALP